MTPTLERTHTSARTWTQDGSAVGRGELAARPGRESVDTPQASGRWTHGAWSGIPFVPTPGQNLGGARQVLRLLASAISAVEHAAGGGDSSRVNSSKRPRKLGSPKCREAEQSDPLGAIWEADSIEDGHEAAVLPVAILDEVSTTVTFTELGWRTALGHRSFRGLQVTLGNGIWPDRCQRGFRAIPQVSHCWWILEECSARQVAKDQPCESAEEASDRCCL